MQNELEEGSLLIFIFLDARYLALFEILIGNHEVAQLLGGCDLVRQLLANRFVHLPVCFLTSAVAIVHLVYDPGDICTGQR